MGWWTGARDAGVPGRLACRIRSTHRVLPPGRAARSSRRLSVRRGRRRTSRTGSRGAFFRTRSGAVAARWCLPSVSYENTHMSQELDFGNIPIRPTVPAPSPGRYPGGELPGDPSSAAVPASPITPEIPDPLTNESIPPDPSACAVRTWRSRGRGSMLARGFEPLSSARKADMIGRATPSERSRAYRRKSFKRSVTGSADHAVGQMV